MTVTVRTATRADAHAIATIRVQTWRRAYVGLIDDEVLDRMDIEREAKRRAGLWSEYHADPRSIELLATDDGEPVGWAAFGPAREDEIAGHGELYAIYALPGHWSSGVGHSLMTAAEASLRGSGFDRAYLWVLEGNERAASFYERHGWREDGTVKDDTETVRDRTLHDRRRTRDLHELVSG